MKYVLKTFWPFPISRKVFDTAEELMEGFEKLIDFSHEFYKARKFDVDLDYYIDANEGFRLYQVDESRMKEKMQKSFLKDQHMMVTKPMFEVERYMRAGE